MNTYKYTSENRLFSPNTYMYTEYEGKGFVNNYLNSRKKYIENLKKDIEINKTDEYYTIFCNPEEFNLDLFVESVKSEVCINIISSDNECNDQYNLSTIKACLNSTENIYTEKLLLSIIYLLFIDNKVEITKIYIDKLLQRFEVNKKIYEFYNADIKKGQGDFENIKNYILLSIILVYMYALTNKLYYINTLLKINDTLCSIHENIQENELNKILLLSLMAEKHFIELILKNKGIDNAIN